MRRCSHMVGLGLTFVIAPLVLAAGAQAKEQGAALYKKHCGVCHAIEANGGKRQGPNLWGVLDRPIGSLEGFKYSRDLKATQDRWTPELLDRWLERPKSVFKSTFMIYRQADPGLRAKIIAYVQSASRQ